MAEQPQVQKLFQASIDKANKRFDEAFSLILECTNLQKLIVKGDASFTLFIPVGVCTTSWGEDLVEFIKSSWKRFSKRVLDITGNKLVLVNISLHKAGAYPKNTNVSFQEIKYQTTIYSILELNCLFNTD